MLFAKLKYVVALLVLVSSSIASADLFVPPGIQPGQQYRLAFVTSGFRDATSADIADYNMFVNDQANLNPDLAALGTTWFAVASTSAVDARDNTMTNPSSAAGVPIYRLDGGRIASNNGDLWDGSIELPIDRDQMGDLPFFSNANVWTGSDSSGAATDLPLGSDFLSTTVGSPYQSDSTWVNLGITYNGDPYSNLYAISGLLMVAAVPEASSLLFFGLVTCGWSLVRLRRKTNS